MGDSRERVGLIFGRSFRGSGAPLQGEFGQIQWSNKNNGFAGGQDGDGEDEIGLTYRCRCMHYGRSIVGTSICFISRYLLLGKIMYRNTIEPFQCIYTLQIRPPLTER